MNETETIEYVGGPVCGSLMGCETNAKTITVTIPSFTDECMEYKYLRSERISVRGHVIFEFRAVAVVPSAIGSDD
jgi:hypothetical protein